MTLRLLLDLPPAHSAPGVAANATNNAARQLAHGVADTESGAQRGQVPGVFGEADVDARQGGVRARSHDDLATASTWIDGCGSDLHERNRGNRG